MTVEQRHLDTLREMLFFAKNRWVTSIAAFGRASLRAQRVQRGVDALTWAIEELEASLAVQISGAARVDAQAPAGDGKTVGSGDAEGREAAAPGEGEPGQETPEVGARRGPPVEG